MTPDEYLQSLSALIHYCEHSERNIKNLAQVLKNVVDVVTADGRVSSSELSQVLSGGNNLYFALEKVYKNAPSIKLNEEILAKLVWACLEMPIRGTPSALRMAAKLSSSSVSPL